MDTVRRNAGVFIHAVQPAVDTLYFLKKKKKMKQTKILRILKKQPVQKNVKSFILYIKNKEYKAAQLQGILMFARTQSLRLCTILYHISAVLCPLGVK